MRRISIMAAAIAGAAVLALSASQASIAASHGGHGFSGGHSFGARNFGGSARSHSFAGSGPRAYGYVNRGGHGRHFHGRSFGYAPYGYYGAYAYGGCSYYYQRAVETGSSYWWARYHGCVGD